MGRNSRRRQGRKHTNTGERATFHLTGRSDFVPGRLGAYSRFYPPKGERDHAITKILAVPAAERSADQWWMLGEYQVYDGLIEEDDGRVSDGVEALTVGAQLPQPSIACLMDLGWILIYRGLDSMALPYLRRATELAPDSRDILVLKALAEIGTGKREDAIASVMAAAALPDVTDGDRKLLAELQTGSDLRALRKGQLLRKISPTDPETRIQSAIEQAKVAAHVLKSIYESDPTDMECAYAFAYAQYCSGRIDRAKPIFDAVVASDAKNAEALAILGLIAKKSGNPELEVEYYRRALEADPDHPLSLTNLAAATMDVDAQEARSYLERALAVMPEGHYLLPNALDLMGNSIAHIEKDYQREAELHRQAHRLDPTNGLYRDNLVLSLLAAGRPIDARHAWQAAKHLRSGYPFQLDQLVTAFCDETLHPYECLQLVEKLQALIGAPGQCVLLKRAWKRRSHVPGPEKLEFLAALATFASQADDDALALLAWQEAGPLDPTGAVRINEAVALERLGQTSRALEIIDSLPPSSDRFFTVLGNIRSSAGMDLAAVEAYRKAVQDEPLFVLPFSNAFDCIKRLGDPSLVAPFIDALERRWEDTPKRTLLLAQAHLLAGRPSTSARLSASALMQEDGVIPPDAAFELVCDPDDDSVFVRPDAKFHKAFASALLAMRDLRQLRDLISSIFAWPRWNDGDWRVMNAEIARLSGADQDIASLLTGMEDQIPAQISLALVAVEQGDTASARKLVAEAISNPNADGYNHPEGRPDALGFAILSLADRFDGKLEEAVEAAAEALRRDPDCVIARAAQINALVDLGEEERAVASINDGLRRLPSEPRMLRLSIETLVSFGRVEDAERVLSTHRAGLDEYDSEAVGFRLGELVAASKLAARAMPSSQVDAAEADWPWIIELDEPLRGWMAGAHHSARNLDNLGVALAMFVGKVVEKLIVDRLMLPFRRSFQPTSPLPEDRFRDIASFLNGGRAPSIGGVVRLLEYANRSGSSDEIVSAFRAFMSQANWEGSEKLRDRKFVRRLREMADIRNESAHIEEPGADRILSAISIALDGNRPGQIFDAFGIRFSRATA